MASSAQKMGLTVHVEQGDEINLPNQGNVLESRVLVWTRTRPRAYDTCRTISLVAYFSLVPLCVVGAIGFGVAAKFVEEKTVGFAVASGVFGLGSLVMAYIQRGDWKRLLSQCKLRP